ncbi:MAG: autotransporter-associated beta strand repeat-containing protein [Opitutales bacterium]|jgi:autotransporter-associated beta strand protein
MATTSAGNATITANGGTVSGANGGNIIFHSNSSTSATAGYATITVNGGSAGGALGATLQFFIDTTAANATIITNGGTNGGAGGITEFLEPSVGGTARAITNAGGSFDISDQSGGGIGIGSIEGAGNYYLGANTLTTGGNGLSTTVSGVIADGGIGGGTGGSLVKVGAGTLTLAGANTYTGTTTISGGTLLVNGSLAGGAVSVGPGAILGGNGTLGGSVSTSAGGIIIPGNLTVSSFSWSGDTGGNATAFFDLGGAGNTSSRLLISGVFSNGAPGDTFLFNFGDGGDTAGNVTYTLVTFASSSGFTTGNFSYTDLNPDLTGAFDLTGDELQFTVTAVPEPAMLGILFAGASLLVVIRRRKTPSA